MKPKRSQVRLRPSGHYPRHPQPSGARACPPPARPPRCGEPPAGSPSPRRPRREEREVPRSLSRLPQPPPPPPGLGCRRTGSGALRTRRAREPRVAATASRRGAARQSAPLPQGGMVHPARPSALSAAAHPPPGRTIPPCGEGGGSWPAARHTHAPAALRPAASRHPAAPRLLPPPGRTAVLTQLLPAGTVHLPAGTPLALPPMWSRPARRGAARAPRPAGANHRYEPEGQDLSGAGRASVLQAGPAVGGRAELLAAF